MIGSVAGGAVMYQAMAELGHAGESGYKGPIKLEGDPKVTSVLILGAGLAGMCAAYELRNAGYEVRVLEYNDRPGGLNWSLYGGETCTELGGFTQHVEFDKGLYINPGPWCLPYHHRAVLHYCRLLKLALEPFTQVNYNAYVHSSGAFGGRPQGFRHMQADFNGHVAELLGKATQQGRLDDRVTAQDREVLMAALRNWGALDESWEYKKGLISSNRRGFDSLPGAGTTSVPTVHSAGLQRCAALGAVGDDRRRPQLRDAEPAVPAGRRHGHDRQAAPPSTTAPRSSPVTAGWR
jgi:monoamine oxidase